MRGLAFIACCRACGAALCAHPDAIFAGIIPVPEASPNSFDHSRRSLTEMPGPTGAVTKIVSAHVETNNPREAR